MQTYTCLRVLQHIQETEDIKHTPIVVPEFGVNKMVADVVLVEYDGERVCGHCIRACIHVY